MKETMQVNSVITFQGVYVDVQEPNGNVHKYVRLKPNDWVWLNSAYAMVDPDIRTSVLEAAYAECL